MVLEHQAIGFIKILEYQIPVKIPVKIKFGTERENRVNRVNL